MRSFRCIPPGARLCALGGLLVLFAAACGDGGTGSGNPTPSITHVDPAKVLQYSDSLRVTVTGSNFVEGAVVRLNGTPRLTSYVSRSQLTAHVAATQMLEAVPLQVTVFNPEPRGGESNAVQLSVEHRVPELQFIEPAGAQKGDPAFTLTVHGAGFAQGSVVRWNGIWRATTFVSPGVVTAQIPASDLMDVGTVPITVLNPNPGGGASTARLFTVAVRPNPVPTITGLAPPYILTGTGATFTVHGTGFVQGAQVFVGGFAPITTQVSATEVQFTLQGDNLPNPGLAAVYVRNPEPGGGNSNVVQLNVENPAPTLTALSPSETSVRLENLTVRVTGTGFVQGTTLLVNQQPRSATRISGTEMEVVLLGGELETPRTLSFRVINPSPGGGLSNVLTLTVSNPAPVVQSISPAQAAAGLDSLLVRVTGTGFIRSSVARFEGSARTTLFVSPTALDVVLRTADLDQAGTFAITVLNPAPGGGTSAAATLTLATPTPTLSDIPSNGASAGRTGFPLRVHGSGFMASSVVRWNGAARTTRRISGSRLEADITTADLASPGTASITVHTPGGGTTAPRQMTVRPVGATTITSQVSLPIQARDLAYEPASNRLYASVPATADAHANLVLAIDPLTGAVVDSVLVGGSPGKLALSDDGSTLWVALDATGQVRRISLPSLALAGSFSLGANRVWDMRVMPGRPGTVAISRMNPCCSPAHAGVAIYDDGVKRPGETPDHTGAELVVFGESASVMYGLHQAGGLYTLRVDDTGVEIVRQGGVQRTGRRLDYANGRVYTGGGAVVDAARHETVDVLPVGASAVFPDATLGRLFAVGEFTGTLGVYDMNTFQLLGDIDTGIQGVFRILRWGSNGLALLNDNGITLLRTPIAGP